MALGFKAGRTQALLDVLASHLNEVRIVAFDGSSSGPENASCTLILKSPTVLLQVVRAPRGLGLARAWVSGELDVEGDLQTLVDQERALREPQVIRAAALAVLRAAPTIATHSLRGAGSTAIEYRRPRPGAHSVSSDIREIEFHYDRSDEFYEMLLGPSLVYSCGMFASDSDSLEDAQETKCRVISEKLELDHDAVVLDVGCGWGSFLSYTTEHYRCRGIGLTASRSQYRVIRDRTADAPDGRIEAIFGDYRQTLPIATASAATSIGVYEHVGERHSVEFFSLVRRSLPRRGRYVNQAIVTKEDGPQRIRPNSFVQRYIFPNGQLRTVAQQLRDLERAGFRVLSVEAFGESYVLTLKAWLRNLERHWDECCRLEGEPRIRAWQMYLMGSLARFEHGSIDVVQVLSEGR